MHIVNSKISFKQENMILKIKQATVASIHGESASFTDLLSQHLSHSNVPVDVFLTGVYETFLCCYNVPIIYRLWQAASELHLKPRWGTLLRGNVVQDIYISQKLPLIVH